MHPVLETTTAVTQLLTAVADANPTFMTPDEKATALRELVSVESRVAELRLRVLSSAGDLAADAGARDAATWLTHHTRVRRTDAAADLRLATALDRERSLLARAVRDGRTTLEQARVIVRSLEALPGDVTSEVAERAEQALVDFSASFDPAALAKLGRRILETVAPDIAEAAEARALADLEAHARRRQRLQMRALGDGTTRLWARLPDAAAARLATYLHAYTNPRQAAETAPIPADPPSSRECRVPYPRRAAEAFCRLLEDVDPGRLPAHGGDATTVVVTISLDSLRADLGVATLDNGVPGDGLDQLTAHEVRRLACNAHLVPAVLGGNSEVLDLGRGQRLFTRAQRKALLLRDRTCRAEGCDAPSTFCEAHHCLPWSRGGPTDLDNALLLCRHHHGRIHDPAYATERLANGDHRFHRRR